MHLPRAAYTFIHSLISSSRHLELGRSTMPHIKNVGLEQLNIQLPSLVKAFTLPSLKFLIIYSYLVMETRSSHINAYCLPHHNLSVATSRTGRMTFL